jgi:NADPH:quinone reductase-like Zn-dependent oxidoreductase
MSELPTMMRDILLVRHGDLDMLQLRENIPVPQPGPRDVLVRVGAAGVSNTDINTRTA